MMSNHQNGMRNSTQTIPIISQMTKTKRKSS
nr:MAG TPA: hypothetical protein [Caudoviricetes sp.]